MPPRESQRKRVANEFVDELTAALERVGAASGRILVALSGGPDSTALLVAANALRSKKPLELIAVHANHALRGDESEQDERFVRDLCTRLGIELVCRRLPVSLDPASRQEGIEETARDLRLELFSETAIERGARFVATAHTADDQAETVLHRIIRGTAVAGLIGIPATRDLVHGVALVRPLLEVTRAQVLQYLATLRQDYREDQSNRDLSFTRNRLRHSLIPHLIEHFNPQLREALVRLSRNAADAQQVIDTQVRRLSRRAAARYDGQSMSMRMTALKTAQPFLVRELVRQLWTEAGWPLRELGHADLERIADIATGKCESWDLPHGVRACTKRGQLLLMRDASTAIRGRP